MFENLLYRILEDYFGAYINDFNKEQLKVGALKGKIVLKNLSLKSDALDALQLPVTLSKGFVGELEVKVPWSKLNSESIVVTIKNVDAIIIPQSEIDVSAFDQSDHWTMEQLMKKQKLKTAELLKAEADALDNSDKLIKKGLFSKKEDKTSYMKRLFDRIVDNIIIHVQNIHFRYEDYATIPKHPFAVGITIDMLSIESTDSEWNVSFIDRRMAKKAKRTPFLHRSVQLKKFSIYTNGDIKNEIDEKRQIMVQPFSCYLKLLSCDSLNDSADDFPKITAELGVEPIQIMLYPEQFRDISMMIERITSHNMFVMYIKCRENKPKERPSENPRAWWHYVYKSICIVLEHENLATRKKNQFRSWTAVLDALKERSRYIELYKYKLKLSPEQLAKAVANAAGNEHELETVEASATPIKKSSKFNFKNITYSLSKADKKTAKLLTALKKELTEMEKSLSFDCIMLYRALAEEEMLTSTNALFSSRQPSMSLETVESVSASTIGTKKKRNPARWLKKRTMGSKFSNRQRTSSSTSQAGSDNGNETTLQINSSGELLIPYHFTTVWQQEQYEKVCRTRRAPTVNLDNSVIQHQIHLSLSSVSLQLVDSASDIVDIIFGRIEIESLFRTFERETVFNLESFSVVDRLLEKDTNFHAIVKRAYRDSLRKMTKESFFPRLEGHCMKTFAMAHQLLQLGSIAVDKTSTAVTLMRERARPCISGQVKWHSSVLSSTQNGSSLSIRLSCAPFDMVYNSVLLKTLSDFASLPLRYSVETMTRLRMLKSRTAAALDSSVQNVFKKHKAVELDVYVISPVIVVPAELTDVECYKIILDLGDLSVASRGEIKHQREADADQYAIETSGMRMLVVQHGDDWKENSEEIELNASVLPSYSMKFSVSVCTTMDLNYINTSSIEVRGDFPELNLYLSDSNCDSLIIVYNGLVQALNKHYLKRSSLIDYEVDIETADEVVKEVKSPWVSINKKRLLKNGNNNKAMDLNASQSKIDMKHLRRNSVNNRKILDFNMHIAECNVIFCSIPDYRNGNKMKNVLTNDIFTFAVKGLELGYWYTSVETCFAFQFNDYILWDGSQRFGPAYSYLFRSLETAIHNSTHDKNAKFEIRNKRKGTFGYAKQDITNLLICFNSLEIAWNHTRITYVVNLIKQKMANLEPKLYMTERKNIKLGFELIVDVNHFVFTANEETESRTLFQLESSSHFGYKTGICIQDADCSREKSPGVKIDYVLAVNLIHPKVKYLWDSEVLPMNATDTDVLMYYPDGVYVVEHKLDNFVDNDDSFLEIQVVGLPDLIALNMTSKSLVYHHYQTFFREFIDYLEYGIRCSFISQSPKNIDKRNIDDRKKTKLTMNHENFCIVFSAARSAELKQITNDSIIAQFKLLNIHSDDLLGEMLYDVKICIDMQNITVSTLSLASKNQIANVIQDFNAKCFWIRLPFKANQIAIRKKIYILPPYGIRKWYGNVSGRGYMNRFAWDISEPLQVDFSQMQYHLLMICLSECMVDWRKAVHTCEAPSWSNPTAPAATFAPINKAAIQYGKCCDGVDEMQEIVDLELSLRIPDVNFLFRWSGGKHHDHNATDVPLLFRLHVLNYEYSLTEWLRKGRVVDMQSSNVVLYGLLGFVNSNSKPETLSSTCYELMRIETRTENTKNALDCKECILTAPTLKLPNLNHLNGKTRVRCIDDDYQWNFIEKCAPISFRMTRYSSRDRQIKVNVELIKCMLEVPILQKFIGFFDGSDMNRIRMNCPIEFGSGENQRRATAVAWDVNVNQFEILMLRDLNFFTQSESDTNERAPSLTNKSRNTRHLCLLGSTTILNIRNRSRNRITEFDISSSVVLRSPTPTEFSTRVSHKRTGSYVGSRSTALSESKISPIKGTFAHSQASEMMRSVYIIKNAHCRIDMQKTPSNNILDPDSISFRNISVLIDPIIASCTHQQAMVIWRLLFNWYTRDHITRGNFAVLKKANRVKSLMVLATRGSCFTMINDYGVYAVPVLKFYASKIVARISSETLTAAGRKVATYSLTFFDDPEIQEHVKWEGNIEGNTNQGVYLAYYNIDSVKWEPMMEPWVFELKWQRQRQNDVANGQSGALSSTSANIESNIPLNINLSYACVETFTWWFATLRASRQGLISSEEHSEYYILNDTGCSFGYWVELSTSSSDAISDKKVTFVSDGEKSPLVFPSSRTTTFTNADLAAGSDEAEAFKKAKRCINICWSGDESHDWHPLLNVPIDKVGVFIYTVYPRYKPASKNASASIGRRTKMAKIAVEVRSYEGSMLIKLCSIIQLLNSTTQPLEILLLPMADMTQQQSGVTLQLGPVLPNNSIALPIYAMDALLSIRPFPPSGIMADAQHLRLFTWWEGVALNELGKYTEDSLIAKCAADDGNNPFVCCVTVDAISASNDAHSLKYYNLTIHPTLQVENLLPTTLHFQLFSFPTGAFTAAGEEGTKLFAQKLSKDCAPLTSGSLAAGDFAGVYESNNTDKHFLWLNVRVDGSPWSECWQIVNSSTDYTQGLVRSSVKVVDGKQNRLRLLVDTGRLTTSLHSWKVTIFADAWFINRTGLRLSYKAGTTKLFGENNSILQRATTHRYKLGEAVEVAYGGKDIYQPAIIYQYNVNGTYDILYENSEMELDVNELLIRSVNPQNNNNQITDEKEVINTDEVQQMSMRSFLKGKSFNRTSKAGGASVALSRTSSALSMSMELNDGTEETNSDALSAIFENLPEIQEFDDSSDEEDYHDPIVMFSESSLLSVRAPNSQWSYPFSLDSVGTKGSLQMPRRTKSADGKSLTYVYEIGVSVDLAPEKFRRTKVITFVPRFVVISCIESHTILLSSLPKRNDLLSSASSSTSKDVVRLGAMRSKSLQCMVNNMGMSSLNHLYMSFESSLEKLDIKQKQNKVNLEWDWSGSFCITEIADIALKVQNRLSGDVRVIRVNIESVDATAVVIFTDEDVDNPLYRIRNRSSELVHYHQSSDTESIDSAERGIIERLFPNEDKIFGWDYPQVLDRKVSLSFNGDSVTVECRLEELNQEISVILPATKSKEEKIIMITTKIEGSTKVLEIKDKQKNKSSTFEDEFNDDDFSLYTGAVKSLQLSMAGIGLSVIDSFPQEIGFAYMENLNIDFLQQPNGDRSLELLLYTIQVDNQILYARLPVLLSPSTININTNNQVNANSKEAFFHLSIVERHNSYLSDCHFFEYFSVLIQEVNIVLEEASLLLTWRFVIECLDAQKRHIAAIEQQLDNNSNAAKMKSPIPSSYRIRSNSSDDSLTNESQMMNSVSLLTHLTPLQAWKQRRAKKNILLSNALVASHFDGLSRRFHPRKKDHSGMDTNASFLQKKIYFACLHLHPIKANVTFQRLVDDPHSILSFKRWKGPVVTSHQLQNANTAIDDYTSFDPDDVLSMLPTALSDIDDAQFKLNALIFSHALVTVGHITNAVARKYLRQTLSQVYKIVASAEILGNPIGLVTNLGSGVRDFFYEPAQGFVRSPQEFREGLARGTRSLVHHTAFGTFDSVSKLSGAIGSGIASLSMDSRFLAERRANLIDRKPKHVGDGMMLGAKSLGAGFGAGLSGIVTQPLRGAEEGGVNGFIKGVGIGIIGAAVKPAVGVFDAVSRMFAGIRNTAALLDWSPDARRTRLPRVLYSNDRDLRVYDPGSAFAQELIIKSWGYHRFAKNDYYANVIHIPLPDNLILIFSLSHAVCLDYGRYASVVQAESSDANLNIRPLLVWEIDVRTIVDVLVRNNGKALSIVLSHPGGAVFNRQYGIRLSQQGAHEQCVMVIPTADKMTAQMIMNNMKAINLEPNGNQQDKKFGFVIQPVADQLRKRLPRIDGGIGYIASVAPNSIAEKAGIKAGDFLIGFGGCNLESGTYGQDLARSHLPSDSYLDVSLYRKNRWITIDVYID